MAVSSEKSKQRKRNRYLKKQDSLRGHAARWNLEEQGANWRSDGEDGK